MKIDNRRYRILVTGFVQGVGFRPMVAGLAEEENLVGQVKNLGGVVEIILSGKQEAVENFLDRLCAVEKHGVGRIDSIQVEELEEAQWEALPSRYKMGFGIAESKSSREQNRFLPVDFPTCDRCKAELFDPSNRRYRYPFISCTQCGPRYSIQKAVPYDRDSITMDVFAMCPECKEEYEAKGNIRRHAQTIGCHVCGPKLKLRTGDLRAVTESMIDYAIEGLKAGKIGAIKDIGGFHFAFSPMNNEAALRLRRFKHRDNKPFAVMFYDLEEIKEYCSVSPKEEELLTSPARPIVLLNKKKDFAPEIGKGSDRIGAMLPCNPLQLLILKETGPLVMTSGNRGGEPIIIQDEDMEALMKQGCPDFILTHDREILTPLDDSIYQVNGEYVQLIRRARGLVPEPIEIKRDLKSAAFAAGGDLKASFALAKNHLVYLSQYFGDLEDVRCARRREEAKKRMEHLLEITPEITVGDLHPSYVSAQGMKERVQHHEAHVASVVAEQGLLGPVLGIACDGTGYGRDGTIWGSEFFVFDNEGSGMKRVGHLMPVKLLGGDAGAKDGEKSLFSYLMEACAKGLLQEKEIERFFPEAGTLTMQQMAWKQNINTVYTSSMGRLFDAAAALYNICPYNSYEGECAILLEQAAHRGKEAYQMQGREPESLSVSLTIEKTDEKWILNGVKLLLDLWKEEKDQEVAAYKFHHALALGMADAAEQICRTYNLHQIVLSGGSFLNRILLTELAEELQKKGFSVYTNEKVPCGDGGIALGQVYMISS